MAVNEYDADGNIVRSVSYLDGQPYTESLTTYDRAGRIQSRTSRRDGEIVDGSEFYYTPQEDGTVRLQRFCIHKDSRSHGAGRLTLRFLEGFFAGRGYHALCLDAKCSAEGFYLKCGYTAVSGVFEEAGVPHVAMRREL